MTNNLLERNISHFLNTYPKFKYSERPKKKCSILKGTIDICDVDGNYWDSFKIEIFIEKQKYPYIVPIVKETSVKIKRDDKWHISEDGFCCLDIDHELEYKSKRGINITSFYQEKIYPFFTNALYKMKKGNYANEEYEHHFDGVIQFYNEKLQLKDNSVIVKILTSVINNDIPGRNQFCVCGEEIKIKNCHLSTIDFLKSLSKDRIQKDLDGFKKSLSKELSI
jgi:hypothetical protein